MAFFDAAITGRPLKIDMDLAYDDYEVDPLHTRHDFDDMPAAPVCPLGIELISSTLLAGFAMPWAVALGRGTLFALLVGAMSPVARHHTYAPLLHLALVGAVVRALQGANQTPVSSSFHLAMFAACVLAAQRQQWTRKAMARAAAALMSLVIAVCGAPQVALMLNDVLLCGIFVLVAFESHNRCV